MPGASGLYKNANGGYVTPTSPNPMANQFNYRGYGTGTVAGQRVVRAGDTSTDPYRGNLATDIQGKYDVGTNGVFKDYSNDSDADVRELQRLQNETSAARAGLDHGVSFAKNQAQMDALKARIGLKNSLGQSISNNAEMEGQAEEGQRYNANQALGQGLKNTRQNFNSRGLLYSGMRESGENAVQSGVASQLASGIASTKRDYANLADAQKAAYANVDLAQQQQKLDLANQAFDTVSRNNVARQQAYQELAGGVGSAVGYGLGSYFSKAPDTYNGGGNPYAKNYTPIQSSGGGLLGADNYGDGVST